MNRLTRKPGASTLAMAMSLACCGLAACLSSTPITASSGVGGGGSSGISSGSDGTFTTSSTLDGETTASFSEPVSSSSGGDISTGSNTTSGPVGPGKRWNFDKNLEGWLISYGDPKDLITNTNVNHDAGAGSPNPGAIHLSIPFNAAEQKIAIAIKPMPSLNLAGRQITAQVKLEFGLANDGKGHGVAKLYVKSGDSFVYADSGAKALTPGANWISIPLTVSNPEGYKADDASYNPSDIREIGIEVSTEGNGSYTAADLHIDSVGYD